MLQATEEGYEGMYAPYLDDEEIDLNPFLEGELKNRVAKKQAPKYN